MKKGAFNKKVKRSFGLPTDFQTPREGKKEGGNCGTVFLQRKGRGAHVKEGGNRGKLLIWDA